MQIPNGFQEILLLTSNLSNDNIISAYARSENGNGFLEARSKNRCGQFFWSKIGSGFGEPGGTPPPQIPRNTLPPLGTEIHTVLKRIPDGVEMRTDEYCHMLQTWNKNMFSLKRA